MAHTDVSKTAVLIPKTAGGIWRVPQNITLPTDAFSTRPVGAIRLGGVSDEGVTFSTERDTEKKKDWNGDKVRSIQQSKDDKFEVTFIEYFNPNVLSLVFGDDNVVVTPPSASRGTQIAVKSVADVLDHGAYIIDTFDGDVKHRRVLPDAQPETIDPVQEQPGDWTVYKVSFDLFPDSQGVTAYTYIEMGDILVPSDWTVEIAGSAGTVVYTVDGESTSAVAYNASTAALDTALEALSTVGAGNATVTGSPGDYEITLDLGGVLSAVGSGGATATVAPA